MPDYREKIVDYVRTAAQPPDKFSHQPRLYSLAVRLAGVDPFDDDVLFAAAWLHDIGVFIGHRPEDAAALSKWDNVAYAIRVLPNLLSELGFPAQKIAPVLEAVRSHLPSGCPTSVEGILLRDADILEQLGATGILRTVCKIGRDTRFITFDDALKALRRNIETLSDRLSLKSARAEATTRVALLKSFLDSATSEGCGQEG